MWHPVKAAQDLAEDVGLKLGLVVLGAGCGVIGLGWLTVALFQVFLQSMSPAGAALLTGGVALLPMVLGALWLLSRQSEKPKEKERDHTFPDAILLAMAPKLARTVSRIAKRHPLEAIMLCAAIGFGIARQPGSILALVTTLASAFDGDDDAHEPPPRPAGPHEAAP